MTLTSRRDPSSNSTRATAGGGACYSPRYTACRWSSSLNLSPLRIKRSREMLRTLPRARSHRARHILQHRRHQFFSETAADCQLRSARDFGARAGERGRLTASARRTTPADDGVVNRTIEKSSVRFHWPSDAGEAGGGGRGSRSRPRDLKEPLHESENRARPARAASSSDVATDVGQARPSQERRSDGGQWRERNSSKNGEATLLPRAGRADEKGGGLLLVPAMEKLWCGLCGFDS